MTTTPFPTFAKHFVLKGIGQFSLGLALMAGGSIAIAAEEKAKEPSPTTAQTAKPAIVPEAPSIATPVSKNPAAPVAAAKPSSNSDQDMAEALVKKISKSSGDIVLRSSDLPPPYQDPKAQAKPEVKVEKKAEVKPKEPPKPDPIVIIVKEEPAPPPPPPPPEIPWTYADGPGGPKNLASLRKENQLCDAGKMQSPINIITDNTVKGNLSPIVFEYQPLLLSLVDNGRSVEVSGRTNNNIVLNEKKYRLVAIHFHKPSEEAFNGERAEMSAHLMHEHYDGSKVIVAVLMGTSPRLFDGVPEKKWWNNAPQDNPLFQIILSHVPLVRNQVASPRNVAINPLQLLPEDRTYYTYMGSLTEPPCTEGVTWIIMKTPLLVTPQQIHSFGQIHNNNVRPLQPQGDRIVKEIR
jgi:carbonic anhydrase